MMKEYSSRSASGKTAEAKKGASMIHLLFICHGNICRSPMAEFIMKELVRQKGLSGKFLITSLAATEEETGHDIYPPAQRILKEKQIPFSHRKARRLTMADYDWADYIPVMDEENREDVARLSGGDRACKASLLLSWAGEDREVSDPWYTGDFEKAYRDIRKGCEALLEKLAPFYTAE